MPAVWGILSLLRDRKAYGVDPTWPPGERVDAATGRYVLTPVEATLKVVMLPGVSVPHSNFSIGVSTRR